MASCVAMVCLAACTTTGGAATDPASTLAAPPAAITLSVADDDKPVTPDQPMNVAVENGRLTSVRLTDDTGRSVAGETTPTGWRLPSVTRLAPDTTYTWEATARNADGAVTEVRRTVRTIDPKIDATYTVTPDGPTVGVGMPVMVTFDSPVATADMRADVERRMKVTTTPAQAGSWGWMDERQLMWRPTSYWKPGTKITVSAPLTGVQTGTDKWITQDKGASFTITPKGRVSRVDLARHVMTVKENGRTVATYPISAGKPTNAWETRSGTKIITEKHSSYVMDAGTLGVDETDPNYYKTEVRYAMRVTNTGEFLHAAPWSVWAQGRRNVSHGCVNLGPHDAAEMFRASTVGDVVEFVGSARRMKPGDGMSVWLFSPREWKKLSAL